MPGPAVANRRLAALAAHVLALAALVVAVVIGVQDFPHGLTVLACAIGAAGAAWWALLRRGAARRAGFVAAALLAAGSVVIVIVEGRVVEDVVIVALLALSLGLARTVFTAHVDLPKA